MSQGYGIDFRAATGHLIGVDREVPELLCFQGFFDNTWLAFWRRQWTR